MAQRLRDHVSGLAHEEQSKELVARTVQFLESREQQLAAGENLPMSTEIVESAIGKYKQLEGQQSNEGFTHLLLTFPVLLRPTTPAEVRGSFARVKVADVKRWEKENLALTLTTKRQLLFREANPKEKRKRKERATPIAAAA